MTLLVYLGRIFFFFSCLLTFTTLLNVCRILCLVREMYIVKGKNIFNLFLFVDFYYLVECL